MSDEYSQAKWLRANAKGGSFAATVPEKVLAHILTMTEEPRKFGFEYAGNGFFGKVYRHNKTPGVVYKIARQSTASYSKCRYTDNPFYKEAADGYSAWAQLCAEYQQEHGNQDFLPDVKLIVHFGASSVYVLGELTEFDDEPTASRWSNYFNEIVGHDESPNIYRGQYDYLEHPNTDGVAEFMCWLNNRMGNMDWDGWDIHNGNIMLRGDVPVLNDPWAHVAPNATDADALTRKLHKSKGIPA